LNACQALVERAAQTIQAGAAAASAPGDANWLAEGENL
jgi:hypothetical protein